MELTILLLTVLPISVFGLGVPKEHFSYGQDSSEGSEAKAGSMVEVGFFDQLTMQAKCSTSSETIEGFFLELKRTLEFFFEKSLKAWI